MSSKSIYCNKCCKYKEFILHCNQCEDKKVPICWDCGFLDSSPLCRAHSTQCSKIKCTISRLNSFNEIQSYAMDYTSESKVEKNPWVNLLTILHSDLSTISINEVVKNDVLPISWKPCILPLHKICEDKKTISDIHSTVVLVAHTVIGNVYRKGWYIQFRNSNDIDSSSISFFDLIDNICSRGTSIKTIILILCDCLKYLSLIQFVALKFNINIVCFTNPSLELPMISKNLFQSLEYMFFHHYSLYWSFQCNWGSAVKYSQVVIADRVGRMLKTNNENSSDVKNLICPNTCCKNRRMWNKGAEKNTKIRIFRCRNEWCRLTLKRMDEGNQ
jgi:hypothetical protein